MMCLYTLFDTLCERCDGPLGAIRSFRNALQNDRKAKVGAFRLVFLPIKLDWFFYPAALSLRG